MSATRSSSSAANLTCAARPPRPRRASATYADRAAASRDAQRARKAASVMAWLEVRGSEVMASRRGGPGNRRTHRASAGTRLLLEAGAQTDRGDKLRGVIVV